LQAVEHIADGELFQAHERGYALGRFTGDGAVEELVRKKKSFDVGADLRQQALGAVLRRLPEENGAETQAAANGLFDDAQAFDGAVAVVGALRSGKGEAQPLDQGVVMPLDATQPVRGATLRDLSHAHAGECIIRGSSGLLLFAVL